jgi:membrane-associated phospholipid phosphatase
VSDLISAPQAAPAPAPAPAPSRGVTQLIAGAIGVIAVVLGGLLIAGLVGGAPLAPDSAWEQVMAGDRAAVGLSIAATLALIGGTLVTSLLTATLALLLLVLRRWRAAIALAVTVSVAAGASSLIKLLIDRARPSAGVDQLVTFSYPSGHTTSAAAVVIALAIALPRVWSWALAVAWIAVMAWSRTYLGVHWLTDVAAGAVLGISVALLVDGALVLLSARVPVFARRPTGGVAR